MAVRRKKGLETINSGENKDRGFSVFLIFVVLLLLSAPVVLLIINPFGWNITPISDIVPPEGGVTPTPSGQKKVTVNASDIIKSDTYLIGGNTLMTTYSKNGLQFTIAIATDSTGSISLGAVSNPQYILRIEDDIDPYIVQAGVMINDNDQYVISSVNLYTASQESSLLTPNESREIEGGYANQYTNLPDVLTIHHISFTYKAK